MAMMAIMPRSAHPWYHGAFDKLRHRPKSGTRLPLAPRLSPLASPPSALSPQLSALSYPVIHRLQGFRI